MAQAIGILRDQECGWIGVIHAGRVSRFAKKCASLLHASLASRAQLQPPTFLPPTSNSGLQFSFRFSRVHVALHSSSSLIRSPRLVLLLALLRIKLCSRHFTIIQHPLLLTYLFPKYLTAWQARGLDLIVNSARSTRYPRSLAQRCSSPGTVHSDILPLSCKINVHIPHYYYFIHNRMLCSARRSSPNVSLATHLFVKPCTFCYTNHYALIINFSLSNVERCNN